MGHSGDLGARVKSNEWVEHGYLRVLSFVTASKSAHESDYYVRVDDHVCMYGSCMSVRARHTARLILLSQQEGRTPATRARRESSTPSGSKRRSRHTLTLHAVATSFFGDSPSLRQSECRKSNNGPFTLLARQRPIHPPRARATNHAMYPQNDATAAVLKPSQAAFSSTRSHPSTMAPPLSHGIPQSDK